jgi:hypothetical protein
VHITTVNRPTNYSSVGLAEDVVVVNVRPYPENLLPAFKLSEGRIIGKGVVGLLGNVILLPRLQDLFKPDKNSFSWPLTQWQCNALRQDLPISGGAHTKSRSFPGVLYFTLIDQGFSRNHRYLRLATPNPSPLVKLERLNSRLQRSVGLRELSSTQYHRIPCGIGCFSRSSRAVSRNAPLPNTHGSGYDAGSNQKSSKVTYPFVRLYLALCVVLVTLLGGVYAAWRRLSHAAFDPSGRE